MNTTTATTGYRRNAESIRRMTINPAPTSRPTYRQNQISWARQELARYEQIILGIDPKMAGDLTEERMLLDRLYEARVDGTKRPELRARLREIRKAVK